MRAEHVILAPDMLPYVGSRRPLLAAATHPDAAKLAVLLGAASTLTPAYVLEFIDEVRTTCGGRV